MYLIVKNLVEDKRYFDDVLDLVYKEWVANLHKDRFIAWYASKKPKS